MTFNHSHNKKQSGNTGPRALSIVAMLKFLLWSDESAHTSCHKVRLYRKRLAFLHFTVRWLSSCHKNYMRRMIIHYFTNSHKNSREEMLGVTKRGEGTYGTNRSEYYLFKFRGIPLISRYLQHFNYNFYNFLSEVCFHLNICNY